MGRISKLIIALLLILIPLSEGFYKKCIAADSSLSDTTDGNISFGHRSCQTQAENADKDVGGTIELPPPDRYKNGGKGSGFTLTDLIEVSERYKDAIEYRALLSDYPPNALCKFN